EGVRHPLGGAFIIGRKRNPDMAIVEDRVVRPIGAFELVQALGDQKAADAIAGHEGKLALEEVKPAKGCELVKHEEQLLPMPAGIEIFSQTPPNLVKHEAHQGFGTGDVGGWHHQVQRDRLRPVYKITNSPITSARDRSNDGIAIEP